MVARTVLLLRAQTAGGPEVLSLNDGNLFGKIAEILDPEDFSSSTKEIWTADWSGTPVSLNLSFRTDLRTTLPQNAYVPCYEGDLVVSCCRETDDDSFPLDYDAVLAADDVLRVSL